ncbi:unnamed protein product [Phaeothamnion confervicola]
MPQVQRRNVARRCRTIGSKLLWRPEANRKFRPCAARATWAPLGAWHTILTMQRAGHNISLPNGCQKAAALRGMPVRAARRTRRRAAGSGMRAAPARSLSRYAHVDMVGPIDSPTLGGFSHVRHGWASPTTSPSTMTSPFCRARMRRRKRRRTTSVGTSRVV